MAYKHLNKLYDAVSIRYQKAEAIKAKINSFIQENGATDDFLKDITKALKEPTQLYDNLSYGRSQLKSLGLSKYIRELLSTRDSYKILFENYEEVSSSDASDNVKENAKKLLYNMRDRYKMSVLTLYLLLKPKRKSKAKSMSFDYNFYRLYATELGFTFTEFEAFIAHYNDCEKSLDLVVKFLETQYEKLKTNA